MIFLKNNSILALLLLFLSFTLSISAQTQAETPEEILTRVAELLSTAKYDEAIALFDTIPAQVRDSSGIRLLRASVLSSAGKYTEARSAVEAVLRAEADNIEALFVLAAIESASDKRREQQTALERIIRIEPNNAEALIALGNLSLQTRAFRPAAGYFHKVLTNDGENVEALLGLARAFRMNTEWDEAEALLNRAVELHPNLVLARNERARFHWGRGNLRQALADFDEAKRISPGDYWVSIDRGNLLFEMNRKSEALEEFTRAIAINPGEYMAYVYSAGIKDELGDLNGAERDYTILAKLKPDYYFALEGLGLHKMKNGQWAEARDAFMEAYRQAPQENLYALLAAISWMRIGDVTAPRSFIAQAHGKVKRDTLEWYMFRLYYDLTARNYIGENDMANRLDREKDEVLKARMLFYMALYYDVRGNPNLANKYYLFVNDLNKRAIPEWRLCEWILKDRGIYPF
jgi:tetratricopeptide (TPR) repeat protein